MKKAVKILIVFIFYNCLQGQPEIVYSPYYNFDIYSRSDGLSHNRINDILQDEEGFLWIATLNGLNRFDGYDFLVYQPKPDKSNSISGELVTCLAEFGNSKLLIGTNKGLDIFDKKNNEFTRLFPTKQGSLSTLGEFVRAIFIDKFGIIWFDTADGKLYEFNIKTGKFKFFQHENPSQVFTYLSHSIIEDGNENLWIGGRGLPPLKFNKNTREFKYYYSDLNNGKRKREDDVTKYYVDNKKVFWVAGYDGLYIYNKKNEEFKLFIGGSTFDMIDFNDNELWIANGRGIKILDRKRNVLRAVQHSSENKYSLPSNYVFKLYKDNAGNIWAGTLEGLCKFSPHKNKFKKAFHIYNDKFTISSNIINSIIEDSDGEIWLGSANNGIDIVNQDFLKIDHLDNSNSSNYKLSANRISKLYKTSKGKICVGLWAGVGFDIIDQKYKTIKNIRLDRTSQKFDWYNDFYEDNTGNLYIGTWGSYALAKFDLIKNKFINKPKIQTSFYKALVAHFITCMQDDSIGNLWIGTSNRGLTYFDMNTKDAKYFSGKSGDSTDIKSNNVTCIIEDKNKNIWIGAGGLNRYNAKDKSFNYFSEEDGLPDNDIQSIVQSDLDNLWIGTLNGLSNYIISKDTFINYYESDGLVGNEFTKGSAILKDGRLVFGTKKGLVVFRPEDIATNILNSKAHIVGLKIFEEKQDLNIIKSGELRLKYNRNYVSFELSSTDLSNADKSKYSYKLENFDTKWHVIDGEHRKITYTYLKPGNYNFLYKASNSDNIWNENIEQLKIIITPPFWKTWWFICLEVLVLLLGIVAFVKFRENKIKEQHFTELLEQRLLRSQLNPHFIFNALGAIQSYIFNHNPIETGTYLAKFSDLMRSILYGSREEYVSLEREIKTLENYLLIQQLRFENRFDYKFEIDPDINVDFVVVPPMLIQPFVENSIEHGFKNLDRKGLITVKVKKENNKIKFVVEDNGVGVNKEKELQKGAMIIESQKEKEPQRGGTIISRFINKIKPRRGDTIISRFINKIKPRRGDTIISRLINKIKPRRGDTIIAKERKYLKNNITHSKHKSLAIKIIKERLRILNKHNKGVYNLKIENRIDENENTIGTKIVFYIPLKNITL